MSNECFERGELPPVGEEFELKPYWHKVRIVAHDGDNIVYWNFHNQQYDFVNFPHYFRPIRTEREKAIEAALSVMSTKTISNTQRKTINKLYDAGLLRLPEDK